MTHSQYESGVDAGYYLDFSFDDCFFSDPTEAFFTEAYPPPPKPVEAKKDDKVRETREKTADEKPADAKTDQKPVDDAFKVNAPPLVSVELPVIEFDYSVDAKEGKMAPQPSLASTRADAYVRFANAEDDQVRLQASMEYLALMQQTAADRPTPTQQTDLTTVKDWMSTQGERVAYQQWYTAQHDMNMKPAAKYAQATQYLQYVNTVYGDDPEKYPPEVKQKFEGAAKWHNYIAQNSGITLDLDALRKANGGVLTHEAIAKATAERLGFKPADMEPYSRAFNGGNKNHAFATSQDKSLTDEQWVESLKDKPSVTIWEGSAGDFGKMKVWAQGRHALEKNLPLAEKRLEEQASEMSREDLAKARAELARQRAKLDGTEPLFEEQKGDPRIRELGAAVTAGVDNFLGIGLKTVDYVTRPLQAASTAVAGSQLIIGDIANLDGDLTAYHVTNLPGAVWERFYEGKVREGFEQPLAQAYGHGVELAGFDRNSTFNKGVRLGLEILGDPTTYATPGMIFEGAAALKGARALKGAEALKAAEALRAAEAFNAAEALKVAEAARAGKAIVEVPVIARTAGESGESAAALSFRLRRAYQTDAVEQALAADLDKFPIKARITEDGIVLDETAARLELAKSMGRPLPDKDIPVVVDGVKTDLDSVRAQFLKEAEERAAGIAKQAERPAAARASDAYRHEPLNPIEQERFEKLGKKYHETQSLTREDAAEFQSLSQRTRNRGPVMISEEKAANLRYEPGADFHSRASFNPDNFRARVGYMTAFEPAPNGEAYTRSVSKIERAKPGSEKFVKDPNLSDAENFQNFKAAYLEDVPTDVRIYKVKNSDVTIEVPESLAQSFDEVRQLRLQADDATNLGKQAEAQRLLDNHALKDAVLPEEMASVIDSMPNKAKLSKVQLLDGPGPQDGFNGFPASADAAPGRGNIRFFNSNDDAANVIDTTSHEWAHLTQEGSTFNAFDAFKKGELIENDFHLRRYGTRNEMEDFAVHFGEAVLNPDAAQFRFFVDRAPLRSVAIGEALRSELATAQASGAAPAHTRQLMERLAYIDSEVVPRAQEQLRQMLTSSNAAERTQAMEYLASMRQANPEVAAKLTHTQALTDVLATTANTALAEKVMPLVYENLKAHPEDLVRSMDRIYANPNNLGTDAWRFDLMKKHPSSLVRTRYLDNQFNKVRGPRNGFWPMDVNDAMKNIDDVSAVAVFEHAYRITDEASRSKLLEEVASKSGRQLAEILRRRAAAIDAGN